MYITNTLGILCARCSSEDFIVLDNDEIQENELHVQCLQCDDEYLIKFKEGVLNG